MRGSAFLTILLAAGVASAGDPRAAEALYQRAQSLMKKPDATKEEIHQACEYFVESYKQDAALNTLVASAACHEKEGKNATAWGEYKEVGQQPGAAGEYARQRAADLEKAGFLKLTVKVHDETKHLTFKIDDAQLSVAPDEFPMDPGPHDLEVSAPGKKSFKRHFELTERVSPFTIDVPELANEDKPVEPPKPVEQPRVVQVIQQPTERIPVYRGFYGYVSTPFWFGTGTGYVPPPGAQLTRKGGGYFGLANVKVVMGYTFGWLGLEGVAMFMFGGRFDDKYADAMGVDQVRSGYPMLGGFFGAGGRATSKHPIIRFTGALALGLGIHQFMQSSEQLLKYSPCDNGGGGGNPACSGGGNNNGSPSPGYSSFAMAGDVGIFLGNGAPSAKLWLGIDWHLDFPPDIVVGPVDSRVPAQFTNNGAATILHGPQFFIGPVIGVGFGH
jgi:hypothetical protein